MHQLRKVESTDDDQLPDPGNYRQRLHYCKEFVPPEICFQTGSLNGIIGKNGYGRQNHRQPDAFKYWIRGHKGDC